IVDGDPGSCFPDCSSQLIFWRSVVVCIVDFSQLFLSHFNASFEFASSRIPFVGIIEVASKRSTANLDQGIQVVLGAIEVFKETDESNLQCALVRSDYLLAQFLFTFVVVKLDELVLIAEAVTV